MEKFLTKSEAAEELGVSTSVISRLLNSGQLDTVPVGRRVVIPRDSVEKYLKMANRIQVPPDKARDSLPLPDLISLSFFSGAGGLDIGLENAGFESVFFCEISREARMTLSKNRPEAGMAGDISNLTATEIRELAGIGSSEIDLMAGGPPCQAFSTAGARRAFDDPRGNIFLKFISLAKELQPRYLVIENVRGLLSAPYPLRAGGEPVKGGALKIVLNKLQNAGFKTTFNLYNSANFGSAQIRERVVIIAKREGDPVPWLTPTHSNDPFWQDSCGLRPWRTLRDAIQHLQGRLDMHHSQFPEKRLKYFRLLSEGQCWTSLPKELQEEAMGKAYNLSGGRTGFYRRLSFDRPSPTLVTSPTMPATDLCHPTELRPLSVEEYSAIQGFPEAWWIAGSISDRYKQIGNAVPVELGEAIGRTIISDIEGRKGRRSFKNFPYSRYRRTSDETWRERHLVKE